MSEREAFDPSMSCRICRICWSPRFRCFAIFAPCDTLRLLDCEMAGASSKLRTGTKMSLLSLKKSAFLDPWVVCFLFEVDHAAHLPSVAGGSEAEIISQAQMIAIGKQADATGGSLLSWIVRHHQNHHQNINHGACLLIFGCCHHFL